MAAIGSLTKKLLKAFGTEADEAATSAVKKLVGNLDDTAVKMLNSSDELLGKVASGFGRFDDAAIKSLNGSSKSAIKESASLVDDFTNRANRGVGGVVSGRISEANKFVNNGELSYAERLSGARKALGGLSDDYISSQGKRGSSLVNNLSTIKTNADAEAADLHEISAARTAKKRADHSFEERQAAEAKQTREAAREETRQRMNEKKQAAADAKGKWADDFRTGYRVRNLGSGVTDSEWNSAVNSLDMKKVGSMNDAKEIDSLINDNVVGQRATVAMKNRFGNATLTDEAQKSYYGMYQEAEKKRFTGDFDKKSYDKYVKQQSKEIKDTLGDAADAVAESKAGKSVDDVMTSKSMSNWIKKNKTGTYDDLTNAINKGSPDTVLKDLYSKNPYVAQAMGEKNTFEDFKKLGKDKMLEMVESGRDLRAANATVMDKLGYNKVPQTVAGIGVTAWMVSRMSESKGQMSNNQLYGGGGGY